MYNTKRRPSLLYSHSNVEIHRNSSFEWMLSKTKVMYHFNDSFIVFTAPMVGDGTDIFLIFLIGTWVIWGTGIRRREEKRNKKVAKVETTVFHSKSFSFTQKNWLWLHFTSYYWHLPTFTILPRKVDVRILHWGILWQGKHTASNVRDSPSELLSEIETEGIVTS